MNNTADPQLVSEVDSKTFTSLVIETSKQQPVLADFWAPWCGPCRTLTPVLERIVIDLAGQVRLAKINSDDNPQLAARFRIQGIPTVLLFKDGELVDRFVGALPERQIRGFLSPHCLTPADRLVQSGTQHVSAHDFDSALADFDRALELDPHCHPARLGLAQVAFARGKLELVAEHVNQIPMGSDQLDLGQGLLEAATLIREAISHEDRSALGTNFASGGHALAEGDHRRALDHFLEVVRLDRSWNREAGRRAMLVVFKVVGAREPLSDEYRDRLRAVLSS